MLFIKKRALPCVPAYGWKLHALAVCLHPIFTAPFQSEAHLESSRTSGMKLFCRNSRRLQAVGYFGKRARSCMFDRILNETSSSNLQLAEGLRRSFPSLGLHKGIFDSPYLLIYTKHKTNQKIKPWTDNASSFHFPEAVEVFSNPTPITQSSINPQENKISNTSHALNQAISLPTGLRGSSQTTRVTKVNLGLTSPPNSLDQHQNHEDWMVSCSPRAPGFQPKQKLHHLSAFDN